MARLILVDFLLSKGLRSSQSSIKVGRDILKFSFHSLATVTLSIILSHQALVRPGLTQNCLGLRSCHLRRRRLSVADVKLTCDNNFRFLRNVAVHITKFIAWTCNKIRQPETASNVSTRSSILVLPQTQRIAGAKISGFERLFKRKPFTRQNSPDSKFPL